MITLKFKYTTDTESSNIIREYRKQYSSVLRYAYNRRKENVSEKDCEKLIDNLNNIILIKSYLKRCAVKNASQLYCANDENVIFGGKKNFIDRCKHKITNDELKKYRLSKLFIIGEANQHGNRMIRINEDLNFFIFKPDKKTNIKLEIVGLYKKYRKYLKQLLYLQNNKLISISYQLDDEYIYLTFDENLIFKIQKYKPIKNRVFGIDINPNYVGWSIVDWLSSNEFKVIKSGVISIKEINDIDNHLKNVSSESKKRKYINNKRTHEVYEISKLLVNIAKYHKCELFGLEELKIKSSDKKKGSKYNKLINNQWNRNKLVNNILKRCRLNGIKGLEVKANYSSFVGNFLFRNLNLPDMILASIEIGRRTYEFNSQYITKDKEQKKNIVIPDVNDFYDNYIKSLEEFNIKGEIKNLVEVYEYLKNSKSRYRVSLEELNLPMFSRCFSNKSKIKKLLII